MRPPAPPSGCSRRPTGPRVSRGADERAAIGRGRKHFAALNGIRSMKAITVAIELDHIFICSSPDGAEAACLTAFGLTEGTGNAHPGQGTACRRFFFRNAYLELLWVSDSSEAQSERSSPTRLWERWTGRGSQTCPFGLGFRPASNHDTAPPFATWEYQPAYLPNSLSFQVGRNSEVVTEPMLICLPFARRRPDDESHLRRQPLEHTAGFREICYVELLSPNAHNLSPELQALRANGLLRVSEGAEYVLELSFDGQTKGQRADLRPSLPLVFKW